MVFTKNGHVAIVQPIFRKIEADVEGGLARIAQRVEVIESEVVMGYFVDGTELKKGDKVLLRSESGLQPWAKQLMRLGDGTSFVLCPESQILGYRKNV